MIAGIVWLLLWSFGDDDVRQSAKNFMATLLPPQTGDSASARIHLQVIVRSLNGSVEGDRVWLIRSLFV